MNEQLLRFFNLFKNLRTMQEIVSEILLLDQNIYNFNEEEAISLIDFFVHKYNREIKLIASLKNDKVVIDNDPNLYDEKDEIEINNDVEYIRDCLIVIGVVKAGMRENFRDVLIEIGWVEK